MTLCTPVTGSNTRVALIPQYDCTRTAPQVERVLLTVAADADATSVSVRLDASYVPGAYVATSRRNLFANTVLFFGANNTPVKVLRDYVLSTTAQVIQVAPLTAPIAVDATADSYLAGILCLDGKTPSANPQTASANEDCDEGNLLKSLIVGVTRDLNLTAQIQSGRSHWALLQDLGDRTANAYFYTDYARLYGEFGLLQLAPVTVQGVTVGGLATFSTTAQVLSYAKHYPASMIGAIGADDTVILTAAQKAANDIVRRLWGFADLNNV